MIDTILAKKIRMTQAYESGVRVPVTVVEAGPCIVTAIKNQEKDGYTAVQIGFGKRKNKNTSKALLGHLKETSNEKTNPRHIKEVRLETEGELAVGQTVVASEIFTQGDTIAVTGISKGRGFAGGVKRYNFRGGPKTHGQSDRHRAPGSIGQGTTPGRVYKGKRMAGHMGDEQVTVKNLRVIMLDEKKNELWLNGPIPGAKGSMVIVRRTSENKVQKEQQMENASEETSASEE